MPKKKIQGDEAIAQIPLFLIKPSPYNPRKKFETSSIAELADSMREHGLLQPVTVRRMSGGTYELIFGERRLRAAHLLGWKKIPAVIRKMDDTNAAAISLTENLQRLSLSVFEESDAFFSLCDEHSLSREDISKRTGLKKKRISENLKIQRLSPSVRHEIEKNGFDRQYALSVVPMPDDDLKVGLLKKAAQNDMSAEATAKCTMETINKLSTKGAFKSKSDMKVILNTIDKAVGMIQNTGINAQKSKTEYPDRYEYVITIKK